MVTLTVCTIIVLCNAHSAAPPKPQPKPPIQSPPRVPVEPLPSFPDKLPPVEPDMYWVLPLVPDTYCMGYGTRAYTAELYIEAVAMQDWHRICVEGAPEVEVSGKIAKRPAWCDRDEDDAVIGHWVVDHDEPECISSWGRVDDKGCTSDASGMRVRTFTGILLSSFLPTLSPSRHAPPFPYHIAHPHTEIRGSSLRAPRGRRLARHVPPHARYRARQEVPWRDEVR
ncbi:hypothetical protein BD626DRAFT_414886 [Schizophyllum amplum]|uniref:Uncharacterized protein n=1 Tax=Schizophyllum amplum TaxID=97359 RepID=A0A550BTU9_9AGAR|nr:hypothetical protein BD626DRAFT_414886 [Auriculariopsis ampla]